MLLFWLSPGYLAGLGAWIAFLIWAVRWLLTSRRRAKGGPPSRMRLVSALLGVWLVLSLGTLIEVVFALCVDHSEAFNASFIAQRWYARHFDSQRNEDGFRERRVISSPLPEGTRRMLFLGDSFTAGHGINRLEDRFTEKLETRLAGRQPPWQVYNAGEPGFDVSQSLALLRASLAEYDQIHMVVYCYMMNDIEAYDPRTTEIIQAISQRRQTSNWFVAHCYSVNWFYHRWVQYSAGSSVDYFPHLVDSYSGPAWNAVRADIQQMQAVAEDKGIPFRIVVFPFMQNLGADYPFRAAHEQLKALAAEEQIPLLDMLPILESHAGERLVVNRFDNHPNERAHSLIAEAIDAWLLADPGLDTATPSNQRGP